MKRFWIGFSAVLGLFIAAGVYGLGMAWLQENVGVGVPVLITVVLVSIFAGIMYARY